VDRQLDGEWVVARTDSHPSTTYQWNRTSKVRCQKHTYSSSDVILGTWHEYGRYPMVSFQKCETLRLADRLHRTIEDETPAGTYRITYYGDSKSLLGSISAFTGDSSTFTVG